MYRVLIVDDEKLTRFQLRRYPHWEEYGFTIAGEATDGKEALDLIGKEQFDLILTDIMMPKVDGIELLKAIKKRDRHVCVIFISGYSDFSYAKEGIVYGAFDYIVKPITTENLTGVLRRARESLDELSERAKTRQQIAAKLEESLNYYYPLEHEQKLAAYLREEDDRLHDEAALTFKEVVAATGNDPFNSGVILSRLLSNLMAAICRESPWIQKFHDFAPIDTKQLTESSSLAELEQSFTAIIMEFASLFNRYELFRGDSLIRKICIYIFDQIDTDPSLTSVAEHFQLNKNYLSQLFKQKTGENFLDFLTRAKMERAKILIREGNYKNYEISALLGYNEVDYFTRLFKNHTGYTPSEYRNLHLQS